MTPGLHRRRLLAGACACAGSALGWAGLLASAGARAEGATPAAAPPPDPQPVGDGWQLPARLPRPELASDEGGLWALMDREETRLRRSAFLLRDAGLRDYLSGIACKLGGAHCADTRVYVVRTPFFNASMAPNGMMQVWTGLLLRADNEAQLAAVIGHEIGHYLQRHSLARLRDVRSRTAFMSVMAGIGVVGAIGQLAALAGAFSFSREHELEADRIGSLLMRQNGWDPHAAAEIWANLRAELSAGAGGDPAQRSVLFATHPASDERQRLLENLALGQGGSTNDAEYAARLDPVMPDLLDDELRRGQFDESIVLLRRLAGRRARRGDLRWALGEAHRQRGQADDETTAQAELLAALGLQNPPPQAHRSLGLLYRRQGRKAEATQAFGTYLQQAPAAPDAALIQSYLSELS